MAGLCHSTFLKSQLSLLKSDQKFQDTALICRNGILRLNSLFTFLLFKEELENIKPENEDLTILLLPEFDTELIQEMIEKLLRHSMDPPNHKSVIAQFSLILPFESSVKSKTCSNSRKGRQRLDFECKVCGKILKRTKWEAREHEQSHYTDEGVF